MLECVESCAGKTFKGYKGREYTANEYTVGYIDMYGMFDGTEINMIYLAFAFEDEELYPWKNTEEYSN